VWQKDIFSSKPDETVLIKPKNVQYKIINPRTFNLSTFFSFKSAICNPEYAIF